MAQGRAYSNPGLNDLLDFYKSAMTDNGRQLIVRLFANDVTVVPGMNISEFLECSFTGYAPENYGFENFADSVSAGNVSTMRGDEVVSFGNSGLVATDVFGYYATDDATELLVFAESFAEKLVLGPTQILNIRPIIKARSREY